VGLVRFSLWKLGLLLLTISSVSTAVGSLNYILGDPGNFAYPFADKYQRHLLLVRTHGVAAALTLLLGPLGFVPKLAFHRQRGQVYMLGVLLGTITAIPMSLMAEGGSISQVGFLVMSLLWGYTGFQAFQTARRRDFVEHRIWVFRNFALSFGAVAFRAYLYHLQIHGFAFHTIYPSAVWVCWVAVMMVTEALLLLSPGGHKDKALQP